MDLTVLRAIANANAANAKFYVSAADGKDLFNEGLITVDRADVDAEGKAAASITEAGAKALNGAGHSQEHTKPIAASTFAIQKGGIELPKTERGFKKGQGGGGAPSKYPFDTMEVNDFIFVANSAVKNGDAVKTLGSAAGSANQRFAKELPETETVQRAKRGPDHKAIKGPDGKNVMETVTVHKKEYTKKFVVRPVKANLAYGAFTAPADGAVVARSQ
jgi:hypothetical protein